MYNLIEVYRKKTVEDLFNTNSFLNSFPIWIDYITNVLEVDFSNAREIFSLGDRLKEIFSSTKVDGRGQSEVSSGGSAWESLICWYMNLCLAGTRTVVVKSKISLIPNRVREAISVNYGAFNSTTESDLVAITFSRNINYPIEFSGNENDYQIRDIVNEKILSDISMFEINVIQCKTNWNDNAQIPMLWDIVYSSEGFVNRNITLGRNGVNPRSFRNFRYSFITVPTSRTNNYSDNTTAVRRVYNISGGNFWGKETVDGISRSIKEIFMSNYLYGLDLGDITLTINNELEYYNEKYIYFFVHN